MTRSTARRKGQRMPKRPKGRKGARRGPGGGVRIPLGAAGTVSRPREETLRLNGNELWMAPTGTSTAPVNKLFLPGASGMTRLDAMAAQYDLYKVHACIVEWRTSAAATTSGRIVLAVDYDASDMPTILTQLADIQPQVRPVCWEDASVRLEPSRMMRTKWLRCNTGAVLDAVAFVLSFAQYASGSVGEVWCSYDVEFSNPKDPGIAFAVQSLNPVSDGIMSQAELSSGAVGSQRPSFNVMSATKNYHIQMAVATPGYYIVSMSGVRFPAEEDTSVWIMYFNQKLKAELGPDAFATQLYAAWDPRSGSQMVALGVNIPVVPAYGVWGNTRPATNPIQAYLLNSVNKGDVTGSTDIAPKFMYMQGVQQGNATQVTIMRMRGPVNTIMNGAARPGGPGLTLLADGFVSRDTSQEMSAREQDHCSCGCTRWSGWKHSRTPWALPPAGDPSELDPNTVGSPTVEEMA
jgi:hypothetical protein